MRSDLCVEHWLFSDSSCKLTSYWIITINGKINVWKFKLIYPTDTIQQNIETTDLKLTDINTSVLIILGTTVALIIYVDKHMYFNS